MTRLPLQRVDFHRARLFPEVPGAGTTDSLIAAGVALTLLAEAGVVEVAREGLTGWYPLALVARMLPKAERGADDARASDPSSPPRRGAKPKP